MPRPAVGTVPHDPVLVGLILDGRQVRGSIPGPDAWEVVRVLAGRGWSDGQIALRVGRTRRQVLRIRTQLGVPALNRGRGWNNRLMAPGLPGDAEPIHPFGRPTSRSRSGIS